MAVTALPPRYPLHVSARLDRPLSRWLWLVKWVLAIPHVIVLALLWLAFVVLTGVAFVAILFTGRYPRAIFDFNVGVLRWSWRVASYGWGALATDRYPPFTLADVPDYPARLDVDYPDRLSRGLVLVKWWLLALPHYIVAGFFVGGGTWLATDRTHDWQWGWGSGGLVGVLVAVCAIVLLFTGRYPQALFDFILGMNRWVLRVGAYAALMTDAYPPFRLDLGGSDPDGVLTITAGAPPAPAAPAAPGGSAGSGGSAAPAGSPVVSPVGPEAGASTPATAETAIPSPRRWSGGRVTAVVIGSVLALTAGGFLIGGLGAAWADLTQRDAGGYLVSPAVDLDTGGYAIRTESLHFADAGPGWLQADSLLGTVRLRVTAADPTRELLVGIAASDAAGRYLSGVDHVTLTGIVDGRPTYATHPGGAPAVAADEAGIWATRTTGSGTVALTWKPRPGEWSVIVADAADRAGVQARADVGATVPALGWLSAGLLIAGTLVLAVGAVLIAVAVAQAAHAGAGVGEGQAGSGEGPEPRR